MIDEEIVDFFIDCLEKSLRFKKVLFGVVIFCLLGTFAIGIQLAAMSESDEIATPFEAHQEAEQRDCALWKQSAENGDANAMVKMGCYHMKQGYFDNAKLYFMKAADKDDAQAMFYLGDCYRFKGDTAPSGSEKVRLYTKAMEYYSQAGEHGYAQAYLFLGMHYKSGKGTEANMDKAVDLWITGAKKGNTESLSALEVNSQYSEKAKAFIDQFKNVSQ